MRTRLVFAAIVAASVSVVPSANAEEIGLGFTAADPVVVTHTNASGAIELQQAAIGGGVITISDLQDGVSIVAVGNANCVVQGQLEGPSTMSVEVVGYASGAGAIASTNITCTVKQNAVTVIHASTTLPLTQSVTAGTKSGLPIAPLKVCTSGAFHYVNGTTVTFGNANC